MRSKHTRLQPLLKLGQKDQDTLRPDLKAAVDFFHLYSSLPTRPVVSTFCEFPESEQKVFLMCKEKIRELYPRVEVWAAGSRVYGRVSDAVYLGDILVRKASDFDLWLFPALSYEHTKSLQRILRDYTGERVDIMPIPPANYFPVLV